MSKESWYLKLKSYVPGWVFEKNPDADPIFRGLAAVMDQIEQDYNQHIDQTFIDLAEEEFVEQIGKERGLSRFIGEVLSAYRTRIKEIRNRSNCTEIKKIVDNFLINGEATIIEHSESLGLNYFSRKAFFNRGVIPTDFIYNSYTILVPNQVPVPVTFFNREHFFNREQVFGSSESSLSLFQQILEAVNENKAFGTVFRVIEQVEQ